MSRVRWTEQDCGEMPLLASEKIQQLKEENKALKKTIKKLGEIYVTITPEEKTNE